MARTGPDRQTINIETNTGQSVFQTKRGIALIDFIADIQARLRKAPNQGASLSELNQFLKTTDIPLRQFRLFLTGLQRAFAIEINFEENPIEFLEVAYEVLESLPIETQIITPPERLIQNSTVPEILTTLTQSLDAYQKAHQNRRAAIVNRLEQQLKGYSYTTDQAHTIVEKMITAKTKQVATEIETRKLPPLPPQQTKMVAQDALGESEYVQREMRQIFPNQKDLAQSLAEEISSENPQIAAAREAVVQELQRSLPDIYRKYPELIERLAGDVVTQRTLNPHIPLGSSEYLTSMTPKILLTAAGNEKDLAREELTRLPEQVTAAIKQSEVIPRINDLSRQEVWQTAKKQTAQSALAHLSKRGFDVSDEDVQTTAEAIGILWGRPLSSTAVYALEERQESKGKEPAGREKSVAETMIGKGPENVFELLYPGSDPHASLAMAIHGAQVRRDEMEVLVLQAAPAIRRTLDKYGNSKQQVELYPAMEMAYEVSAPGGILEELRSNPLYQVAQPLIDRGTGGIRNKALQRLARTGVGKAVSSARDQVIVKVVEPLKRRAIRWALKNLAEVIGKETLKIVIREGLTAAIAAATGIPTGGVTIILWIGWELLQLGWGLIKKAARYLGVDKLLAKLSDLFSIGLNKRWRELAEKVPLIGRALATLGDIIIPIFMVTASVPLVPIFIVVFVAIFLMTNSQQMMWSSMRPPLMMGGAEEGLPPGYNPIEVKDLDKSQCDPIADMSAKAACLVTIVAQNCSVTPGGMITNSNVTGFNQCLQDADFDDGTTLIGIIGNGRISRMTDAFSKSANGYVKLQCVGFKYGIEPGFPGGANALMFVHSCTQTTAQAGVNAVFGPGRGCPTQDYDRANALCSSKNPEERNIACCGHIGIVIGVEEDQVLIAQAWGDNGKISVARIPTAAVTSFIDCR